MHITKFENLKYFSKNKYQRIYWGVEFCQNLIPNLAATKMALRLAEENGLHFTLITPFVTDTGLKRLIEIFTWFKGHKLKPEIVVNDWGLAWYLHNEFGGYFELSLGRLLARQNRNPLMKKFFQKHPPSAFRDKSGKISLIFYRGPGQSCQQEASSSYVAVASLQKFMVKLGIKRIELNNTFQGLNLAGIRLKKTVYTPYVNISTTRFCPMESKLQKTYRIDVCKRECQNYYYILRNKIIGPVAIYKRGSTIFYKNPLDMEKAQEIGVDRVVFQPQVPL